MKSRTNSGWTKTSDADTGYNSNIFLERRSSGPQTLIQSVSKRLQKFIRTTNDEEYQGTHRSSHDIYVLNEDVFNDSVHVNWGGMGGIDESYDVYNGQTLMSTSPYAHSINDKQMMSTEHSFKLRTSTFQPRMPRTINKSKHDLQMRNMDDTLSTESTVNNGRFRSWRSSLLSSTRTKTATFASPSAYGIAGEHKSEYVDDGYIIDEVEDDDELMYLSDDDEEFSFSQSTVFSQSTTFG